MTILSNIDYFKELPFYNVPIDKPKIKRLKNFDLLPFYDQLNIKKTDNAFSGYEMSYNVEIIDKKDLIVQLEASKPSIKDLLNDLLKRQKALSIRLL